MARIATIAYAIILAVTISNMASAESLDGLHKRLSAASSSIEDMRGTMVLTPASRSEAGEINKGVIQFLDHGFREAAIYFMRPDKFRIQGKSRGIDVTYVLNGNRRQTLAPALMLKKTEDISDDLAKRQSTLDLGFASDSLWRDKNVKLLSESAGVAKLQLVPKGTTDKRKELVWIETKSLKLLKRERYGAGANLKARYVYSGHKMVGRMPVGMLVKAYAPDGGYAGSIKYENIRANTGLENSLFVLK